MARAGWALLIATGAGVLLLGVTLAALLAVSHGWQRERVRGLVEEILASRLGAEVRIAALEGTLHEAFEVREILVSRAGAPLLAVGALHVRVEGIETRPFRLVLASLDIADVEVRSAGPRERVRTRSRAGGWSASVPDPLPLAVRRLTLRDGSLLLGPEGDPRALRGRFTLAGELSADAWTLERAELHGAGIELSARGRGDARAFDILELELRVADVTPLAALLGAPVQLEGRLEAELSSSGAFAAPQLSGRVGWLDAAVAGTPLDALSLRFRPQGDRLRLTGELRRQGQPLLAVDGTLPSLAALLAGGDPISSRDVEIELRAEALELSLLQPLLPPRLRELRGRASGRLSLRGAAPQPELRGLLELTDAGIDVPLLGRSFAGVSARVVLEPGRVRIAAGLAEDRGHASLEGRVELEELRPSSLELRLELHDLRVVTTRLARARASGELVLEGPLEALEARGAIALGEVRVRVPDPADPTLEEIRILSEGGSGFEARPEEPDLFDRTALALRLRVPADSWVRGSGLTLEVAGELELRKRPLEPALVVGSLQSLRGSYTIHGKRFVLRRGLVTFDGGLEPDPLLDVEAEHRVGDVTVLAFVSGRVSDPLFRLASDPPRPEEDLVALLVFGRAAEELSSAEGTLVGSAAAGAAATLALGELEEALDADLPVDTVDIRIEEDETSLSLGSYLTERVFVEYGHSVSGQSDEEVSVEVRLTPHWSVRSDLSSSGEAGADVIWSYDY